MNIKYINTTKVKDTFCCKNITEIIFVWLYMISEKAIIN